MKKTFLVLFLAVIGSASAYAQLQFGLKAGLSSSKVQLEDRIVINGTDVESINTEGAQLGFHAGVFARLTLLGFFVQPEALFTSAGGKITAMPDATVQGAKEQVWNLDYNKVDVPIMVGKSFGPLRLNVGPVFSFLLGDDVRDVGNLANTVEQNYKNSVIGYQAGLGLDIGKLLLDLRYEGNLSKFGDSITIDNNSFQTDMRQNQIIFSVGLNLL
jgi:hypothetical protein